MNKAPDPPAEAPGSAIGAPGAAPEAPGPPGAVPGPPGAVPGPPAPPADPSAGRPADRMMAEAVGLIDQARLQGVQIRLTGGFAVRRHCTDLAFMDREFSDIDFIAVSQQARELRRVMGEQGYDENPYVAHATAESQLQFVKREPLLESRAHFLKRPRQMSVHARPVVDHIDVFMDVMRMDHDVDVRGRLDIDEYAISPVDILITKLQIGEIAEKDVHDVIALLKDVPLGEADDDASIDVPYLAEICARDWGIYYDITTNIDLVLDKLDDYALSDEERTRVYGRLTAVEEAIDDERKTIRWRLRARLGTRVPWHREVEEREGSPVMPPDWDVHDNLG